MGRSKICDLVLQDNLASRQHCILEPTDAGQVRLVDLQSANGTQFQGQKIDKQAIKAGDSFKIGDTEIHIERISKTVEESTVFDLTPVEIRQVPELTGTKLSKKPQPEGESTEPMDEVSPLPIEPPADDSRTEVSLKTPVILKVAPQRVTQTKDWVQVSLFWKEELIDIKCFDRGQSVHIGTGAGNDLVIHLPGFPDSFEFLKILPTGIEMNLHASMNGLVETRKETKDLEELRKLARPSEMGLSTFIPFEDRCLIEMGPFSFFIQAVRLRITEALEAPLVKEAFFSGVLATVATSFVLFLLIVGGLSEAREDVIEEEPVAVLQLEKPEVEKPKFEPLPTPPAPKPKVEPRPEVKTGPTAQKKVHSSGTEGQGARAKGAEGKRGSKDGTTKAKGRAIGYKSKASPPKKAIPKGAFGSEKSEVAKRGLTPDRGVGTGKEKPKGTGQQVATLKPKPKIRVEDQGILGVLGSSGGGGKSSSGGRAEGEGLGGALEGALAGLERVSTADGRGAGGRGERGKEFGGGGSSLDVGGLGTKGKGGGRSGFGLGSSGKKGEAEVSYVQEEVEVRDGLTREEIERVVMAHQNEIRACYEKALINSGNMNLSGRLKVGWFVNRSGRAQNLQQQSSFGNEAGLFDCVARRIESWQFPQPRGGSGAQVSWPFVFRKGG